MTSRSFVPVAFLALLAAGCAASQPPGEAPRGHHHENQGAMHDHHDKGGPGAHGHHGHHGHHDHRAGAPHRFENADEWARHFESPERDAWQKPDAVVAAVGLGPAQTLADIGAGTGYFAVRFARKSPGGKVYGVDIEPDMVRYMKERAGREKLPNLTPVLGTAADPAIPAAVDVIFLCDTYHHIDERTAYFRKVAASLAPGGRLVIVDFKKTETPVGPPLAMRVEPSRIDAELAPAGFRRASLDEATLPHQYIVTYRRD
jgi:SAM-dependent methyltransferase